MVIKKLLHCDDDPFVVELVSASLEVCDITCLSFTTGVGLIDSITAFEPDVVLLDRQMAPVSGIEIAAEMASVCPHIPVIFISGMASSGDELPVNVAGEILKPFDLDLILEKIVDLCDRFAKRKGEEDREREGKQGRVKQEVPPDLSDLRQEYLGNLTGQMKTLSSLLTTYFSTHDHENLDASAKTCHKIVGTSGLYGFGAVSIAAGELEDSIESLIATRGSSLAVETEALLDKLDCLERQVEEISFSV